MDKLRNLSEVEFISNFRKTLSKKDYNSTTLIAIKTAEIFRDIIQVKDLYSSLEELLLIVKTIGKMFIAVDLMQFSVGNIVKRILHIINLEKQKHFAQNLKTQNFEKSEDMRRQTIYRLNSLCNLVKKEDLSLTSNISSNLESKDFSIEVSRDNILSDIEELISSLEESSNLINNQAHEHINNDDIILTANNSGQLHEFLLEAAKTKNFHVIIAESCPSMSGRIQARNLSKKGIKTTLISDSSIFALIPRVNKVVIGTRAVMANGGLISYNGVTNICLAAQTFSIPVVVIASTFKFTPMYPFDHETFNEQLSPDTIYNSKFDGKIDNIKFNSPAYDYVPPDLITIYITDLGPQVPAYIYRMFNELYSQEDYFL